MVSLKWSRSPSSSLLPFFGEGGGFPYYNRLQKEGYPYFNLATRAPRYPSSGGLDFNCWFLVEGQWETTPEEINPNREVTKSPARSKGPGKKQSWYDNSTLDCPKLWISFRTWLGVTKLRPVLDSAGLSYFLQESCKLVFM